MATLNGTSLGDVQSERQLKDGALFNFPLPGTDADKKIMLDLFGVSRTITVEGIFADTEANIRTFITAMEALIAGTQTGVTFVSDLVTATPTVFVNSFDWSYSAGDPRKISYTLVLEEGAAVA